jgi:hypothetical protein
MASITKVQNNIVVQCDNSSQPAVFSNWKDAKVTYGTDHVQLTIGNQGFRFAEWDISPCGELTTVNGVSVTLLTNGQIAGLIRTSVLTEDQFSGTPVIIDDTTMVAGQFTAIQAIEDSVLDVSDAFATVQVDGQGTAIDVSGYAGAALVAGGTPIYGNFTQVQLVSGTVIAYSNL